MLGHIKSRNADGHWQGLARMSRIYGDLGRSSHHSLPSRDRSLATIQRVYRQKGKIPHIAVIGAGISGLRCADVLIESGAKVTIYEARDRIGGRVHQVSSGGRLMDIGANWIHGTENNPIAAIARHTESTIYQPEEGQAVVDSVGKRIEEDVANEASEVLWNLIAQAFRYSDEKSAEIDKSKSLMDFFRERIPAIVQDPKKQSLVLEEAQMWGAFVGDSVSSQSLKFFFLEECIEGDTAFVADTHEKILAEIAATALSKAEMHFNEEVVFFDTQERDSAAGLDPQTTVHTRSGKQQSYDEVVITVPLGWLKRHAHDAFPSESPLPPRLLQAIDNTSYGRLEKVYITFPSAFWQEPAGIGQATSLGSACSPPCPDNLQCNSSSSSSSSTSSPSPSWPFSTHFLTPDYTPRPRNTPWNQSMINLAALPTTTAQPTLLFYLYGACGSHLINLLATNPTPDSIDIDHDTQILRSFFEPYYSLLPNYDPNSPSCTPTAFLATKWQSDPHAGHGSYTNFQIGLEDGDHDIEVMRYGGAEPKPIDESHRMESATNPDSQSEESRTTTARTSSSIDNDPGIDRSRGLWLAGEHTAPFIALGTTTGAYWSGEAVARRILDLYKL